MFLGILSTLLGSVNTITYKRASNYAERFASANFIMLFVSQCGEWPLYFIAHFLLPRDQGFHFAWSDANTYVCLAFFTLFLMSYLSNLICQYAYANEKLSVLSPYSQLGSVFTIILGVIFPFARGDTSWGTIAIAICTAIVILIASIDFKNFTFNRYCALISLDAITEGIFNIVIVWLLLQFTSLTIIVVYGIMLLIAATISLLVKRVKLPLTDPALYTLGGYMLANNSIWLTKELAFYAFMAVNGLLMATLLGMVQFATTLVLSYFVFHDKPSRKDIALGVFVTVAVSAGLGM